jgi:type 1 glutamine amidotransferase
VRAVTVLLAALLLAGSAPATSSAAAPVPYKVLVFTHATGYRHASIPAGVKELRALGNAHGFTVTSTSDPATFSDKRLKPYAAVVFLSTTGNPLPTTRQRQAFQRYIEHGGGFVGIHAASDLSISWPWYTGLVGAAFSAHPPVQLALVHIEDHHNPATAGLSDKWRLDEWYDFRADPRPHVHVLADVDDTSYTGSAMGSDHPITWCQVYDGGRSFYSAMGHSALSLTEPWFAHQLLGMVQGAAGVKPADCAV